jgi:hypothetical protein
MEWRNRFQHEIKQAEAARAVGNEGRARVCSRRAAGVLVEEFFKRQRITLPSISAYDNLKYLTSLSDISPRARELTDNLLMKVEPNYSLPKDVDLIEDARLLEKELLGDEDC